MEKIRLGRTELSVGRTAFGALPIQRLDFDAAKAILRQAYAGGINFFDTARAYSDSEEKIGYAMADLRSELILATKTFASDRAGALADLKTSLGNLKTDHVDILQLHNPAEIPSAADPDSSYAALLEARERGQVRFLGITSHKLPVAMQAARSGMFDTVQFPLSAISADAELELIKVCREEDVGVIAMKAVCGGLLRNIPAGFAFFRQFDNVVPIWGIQRQSELEQFLALENDPPALDEQMRAEIEKERAELGGDFCRSCGYCLPCPADIPIPMAARMGFLLRRAVAHRFLTESWQEQMQRIEDCTDCGRCREHCPYELDPPVLMKKMLADYRSFL